MPDLESVSSDGDIPDLVDHDYEAEEAFYNQQIAISNNFNEITISDLSSAFRNFTISDYYLNYNMFRDNINIFRNDMDIKKKIITVFHRDYHRKRSYLNVRRLDLMADFANTISKVARMVYNYLDTTINDGTIEVLSDPLIIALQAVCKKQADSKSSREVLRLMQLGFLGSCKWDSSTSTQHFEMLDIIDDGRVELLKSRSSTRFGAVQTRSEENLEPLQQQLVAAMRSELKLMSQMGVFSVIIPDNPDGLGIARMSSSFKWRTSGVEVRSR